MLEAAGTLSINRFTGNGVQTAWNINFAGGYMQQSDIHAYTTVGDVNTIVGFTWTGLNTINITPAVANGVQLTVYRDTPKNAPVVDFTDGAIVNEINLDKLAAQAVFTAAEMVDRFGVVNDKADAATVTANLAKATADTAISNTALIVGGDFTKFGRTDVAATWTTNQNFTGGLQISGANVATQTWVTTQLASYVTAASLATTLGSYVTSASLATSLGSYSTTTQMNTAISTAQTAAATDATNKANAAQAAAIAAVDPEWLYTLATR
jgi:hypothetical protein